MWWELFAQAFEIEVGMQVGQDRPRGFDALDPGQGILHAEMTGMRTITQRVDDPHVDRTHCGDCCWRQPAEIAGIDKAAEAKTERANITMLLEKREHGDGSPLPLHNEGPARLQLMRR